MERRPLGAIDPNSVRAPTPEGRQQPNWQCRAFDASLHLKDSKKDTKAVAKTSDS